MEETWHPQADWLNQSGTMRDPINRYLDAAILKPEMTREETARAIRTCVAFNTITACVRPCDIPLARSICTGTDTGICVVLGFPHGCGLTGSKVDEAGRYVELGVHEIDMVANIGWIRSHDWLAVTDDIAAVSAVTGAADVPLKVIFETSFLTLDEIARATECAIEARADFVKTSTGFGGEGATEDGVRTMLETAAGRIKVKPSGGIRDRRSAERFLDMGAHRLGVGYTSCEAICGGGPASGSGY
jgi:deoxyribose-phosphate aldolase